MQNDEGPDWGESSMNMALVYSGLRPAILGSVHDAEDVAQDVFIEAYRLFQAERIQSWAGLLVRLATLRAIDRRQANAAARTPRGQRSPDDDRSSST